MTPDTFTSLENSDQYYEEVILGPKRVFNCLFPDCGKTFRFRSEIKRHLTIHSSKRFYHCSFPGCTKSFKRADALASHAKVHSTTSTFDCYFKDCDATFNTKSALNYHLLTHGEKNFVCSFSGCNKAFRTYAQVKQHEKTYLHHKQHQNLLGSLDLNFFENNESSYFGEAANPIIDCNYSQENYSQAQIPALSLISAPPQKTTKNFQFLPLEGANHNEILTNDCSENSPVSNLSGKRHLTFFMDFVMEENHTLKKKLKNAFCTLGTMKKDEEPRPANIDVFFTSSEENDFPQEKSLASRSFGRIKA